MNIHEYKEFYRTNFTKHNIQKQAVKVFLDGVLNKIKFLESIYITGGDNSGFSKEFKDSAYKEREELCQESSALFTILRDDYNKKEVNNEGL